MDRTLGFLYALVTIFVYLIPWFIACYRNHRQKNAIAALDIFLGWTFLGWVAALWWSCRVEVPRPDERLTATDLPGRNSPGDDFG